MKVLHTVLVVTCCLQFSCSERKPPTVPAGPAPVLAPESDDEVFRTQAQAVVTDAAATLTAALTKAMGEGGVPGALRFCSENASGVTESITRRHPGLAVQRVSAKNRNPANAAGPAELEVLATFAGSLTKGRPPQPVVREESGQKVFYAPILLGNPLCLQCHGNPGQDIAAENAAIIRQLYPEDKATGFRQGDLRGMWRVAPVSGKAESPKP